MTPQEQAHLLLATYDRPEASPDECHIVRITRTWLQVLTAEIYAEGVVEEIVADFLEPTPPEYGSGWIELREAFMTWAQREEYL
ncbi:MAG: hypothetical protein ACI9TH_000699 [Kiritimatiellia bacterium]|jgi:hypothetical protein